MIKQNPDPEFIGHNFYGIKQRCCSSAGFSGMVSMFFLIRFNAWQIRKKYGIKKGSSKLAALVFKLTFSFS